MQHYAIDETGRLTAATAAIKQHDYFCVECKGRLRVRIGSHRQPHFFHLVPSIGCRQAGKSMRHLQVQAYLQENLPGTVHIERPFPSIARIADVVWEEEAVIFEVQCSAILAKEVKERNADYASLGYAVIWVLHDSRFNGPFLTAAERFLIDSPHYFTDIDASGKGGLYDQFTFGLRGKRAFRSLRLPVQAWRLWRRPSSLRQAHEDYPWWRARAVWPLGLGGDLTDLYRSGAIPLSVSDKIEEAIACWQTESSEHRARRGLWRCCLEWIHQGINAYDLLFHLWLEKFCR